MKNRLSAIQVEYVLEHIGHHVELHEGLRQVILYGEDPDPGSPAVFFPASEEELRLDGVILVEEIPVLYPMAEPGSGFYKIENGILSFHHDILKSIFHLLSGYEEVKNGATDQYGRFPFTESLQFKLGIIDKPVVNYYMEIILRGLEEYCEPKGMIFRRKPGFGTPVLMLSHDIDFIKAYSFRETAFKFKQLLGLADSPFSGTEKIRETFVALFHFLNPFSKNDPFWNFEQLMLWEAERGFRCTYFFLEKDGNYENSRYRFHYKKIRKLISELSSRGHEVGIHGTMQSYDDLRALKRTLENLKAVAPQKVSGIRQHFLRFKPNITAQIQEKAGLEYDASLGFAEHEGFRNSYCWPFKFFDFTTNRIMDHWEIPLAMMDVSHFYYRRLNLEQSREAMEKLVAEVMKFNGVFSFLWHNSFFNEREFPGITGHYTSLLDLFHSQGMEGKTGTEIIEGIKGESVQEG